MPVRCYKVRTKGAPARKSRTWPRLVSPATGRKKKILHPPVLVKNWVLENISSKVDTIRNQHPYVSNYVSAKSGKMWHLEKKKKVQAALQ